MLWSILVVWWTEVSGKSQTAKGVPQGRAPTFAVIGDFFGVALVQFCASTVTLECRPLILLLMLTKCVQSTARLSNVVVDRGCRIPEDLVIGEDPELDARRFYRSDYGITLVSADMLAALG
jgi:hypothetical protein